MVYQRSSAGNRHFCNLLARIEDHINISSWMTAKLLTLNSSKTEFLLISLSKQLAKINNSSLCSKPRLHIRWTPDFFWPDLICLQVVLLPYLSTLLYPSIPLYLNSFHHRHFHCSVQAWLLQLYHNLPKSQITQLQQIQNSLARAVVKASKSSHITPILLSLHWFNITERIEYKLLSLTYKVLSTTQPSYLHNLITVQPPRSTRSSSLIALARPSTSSSLRITDRSFLYAFPYLWNQLPAFFHQPRTNVSNSASPSSLSDTSSISSVNSPHIIHHPFTLSILTVLVFLFSTVSCWFPAVYQSESCRLLNARQNSISFRIA